MNIFFRAKRRARQEWRGVKSIAKQYRPQIRLANVIYETSRIIYNPWYLVDILVKKVLL